MLQGPYSNLDRDRLLIRLPFKSFSVGTFLLPVTGFIACIFISLWYHYEEATYTHCKVSNYLPSISSAISGAPERYIWSGCIGLHSAPRYLVAFAYFSFYRSRFADRLPELLLSGLALLCSLAENTGLVMLTYVSSTETYSVHKYGFITFIGSSLVHMLITCWLWYSTQEIVLVTQDVKHCAPVGGSQTLKKKKKKARLFLLFLWLFLLQWL
uniref:Acyltransferase PGAP2 n=1 Tax=Astatotilapia calliptera TaxID=8154 RepID=A0A3P8PNI6_ASTCA